MEKIMSEEVELIYRKGAEHRFSDKESLRLLETCLEKIIEKKWDYFLHLYFVCVSNIEEKNVKNL